MRKRAKTVQTPLALDERQRTRQGIAWILKAAEKGRKGGLHREVRIAREVLGVLEGNSDVFRWLEERHKVATANRWVSVQMTMLFKLGYHQANL
jgi:small subunit ribosomal protein S7